MGFVPFIGGSYNENAFGQQQLKVPTTEKCGLEAYAPAIGKLPGSQPNLIRGYFAGLLHQRLRSELGQVQRLHGLILCCRKVAIETVIS